MTRRLLGVLAAAGLALFGTVVLVSFVTGAVDRRLEGEELVEVYVVAEPIPVGTPATELEELVEVEEVPLKVRPLDSVENLLALGDQVAAVELLPGEQLITTRFIEPSALNAREAGVDVPPGMLELTISLEPQRAIGGLLEPGQTVAILASFDKEEAGDDPVVFDAEGQEVVVPAAAADDLALEHPASTDVILRKVLVSAVQTDSRSAAIGSGDDEENDRLNVAPSGGLLVTVAVIPSDAERLVLAAEQGTLWFAIDRDTVPDEQDPLVTRDNIHRFDNNRSEPPPPDALTEIVDDLDGESGDEDVETEPAGPETDENAAVDSDEDNPDGANAREGGSIGSDASEEGDG